jgi:WD40 repeat protein
LISRLTGHENGVTACAVSPDGRYVISASADSTVKIWSLLSGLELATLRGDGLPVRGCAVTPGGTLLFTVGDGRALRTWDLRTGRELREEPRRGARTCAVSPDGSFVVSDDEKTLVLWDLGSGGTRILAGHADEINDCAVSPDGAFVLSASSDRTLKLWDARTGRTVATLPLPAGAYSAALHPYRPLAMCGDATGNLNVLELVGVAYGPLIVTAGWQEESLVAQCPRCRETFPAGEEMLGRPTACGGCGAQLRLNPFALGEPRAGPAAPTWKRFLARMGRA